jgi:2-polyprenyl-3-methyl-5-hydroxy-6-metoxy-1,4-benzoquinol methylase
VIRCACCDAEVEGEPAFVHPAVPLFLNVLAKDQEEARQAPTGRLELFECATCGFVFNRAFTDLPYGQDYFLDATRSPRYRRHLDGVSDRLAERMSDHARFTVVDVGAGQGTFLAHLVERLKGRVRLAHGFDPAFRAAAAALLPANVGFTASVLDAQSAAALDFPVDAVVTRHVVEHVIEPVRFLRSIRESIGGRFELMVETPNVAHSLERGLLHDFCYEHCAMMSGAALVHALRRAGYERVTVEPVFDGEYLLAFASVARDRAAGNAFSRPLPEAAPRRRLARIAESFVAEHRQRLQRARARGPIALWGGAGKGALFAHLIDPDRTLVELVVDIHPDKQGTFLPGAGHPVVSPEDAVGAGVRTVVVANPTYLGEIVSLCDAIGLQVEIECVGTPDPSRSNS